MAKESLGSRLDNMPSKSEEPCENFFFQKIEDPVPTNKEEATGEVKLAASWKEMDKSPLVM